MVAVILPVVVSSISCAFDTIVAMAVEPSIAFIEIFLPLFRHICGSWYADIPTNRVDSSLKFKSLNRMVSVVWFDCNAMAVTVIGVLPSLFAPLAG
jgi:hypothetical protein